MRPLVLVLLAAASCASSSAAAPSSAPTTVLIAEQPTLLPPPLMVGEVAATAGRLEALVVTEPPPAPTTTVGPPAGSSDCEQMSWWRSWFGMPARFDQIGRRESGPACDNTAVSSTGCCVGWWQLHYVNFGDHRMIGPFASCGATWRNVRGDDADSKRRQACAAAALFVEVGYQPWATS